MTTAVSKGLGIPAVHATFKAYDADLGTKQFCIAKITSSGIVDWATAATDTGVIGVIDNDPYAATGADVDVIVGGEAKLKIGGTVAAGAFLVADSSGYGVAITLGTTTNNYVVGRALEDGEANDIIRVLVIPFAAQV